MERMQSGDQIIRYDRGQTRMAYSAMRVGWAERCGCSYCLNFAAQRATAYPENFRLLLNQLGIDPEKEGEVYECGPDGQLRAYGGWFFFVGELIEAGERMTDATPGFQYFFTDAKRLPSPQVDFGKNVLAVEFTRRDVKSILGATLAALLSCRALSSATTSRFIPALSECPAAREESPALRPNRSDLT